MENKVDIYICSKPLQWFNARNIANSSGLKRVLIFIGSFSESRIFFDRLKVYDHYWDQLFYVQSRKESKELASKFKIHKLFVDCDYGKTGFLYSKLQRDQFFVYEEGIGSYFDLTSRSRFPKLKRLTFKLLGWGVILGGARFTDGVYVYNTRFYEKQISKLGINSKKIKSFGNSFFSAVSENEKFLKKIFECPSFIEDLFNKRVLLYLVNYGISEDALEIIGEVKGNFDLIIIKLHPNMKNVKWESYDILKEWAGKIMFLSSRSIMAELLVFEISKNNKLTVLHEGSTACIYIDKLRVNILETKNLFTSQLSEFSLYLD